MRQESMEPMTDEPTVPRGSLREAFAEPLGVARQFLLAYLPCIAGWGLIGWAVYPLFNDIPPGVKVDPKLEAKLQSALAFITAIMVGAFTGKMLHLVLMIGDELKTVRENAERIAELESEAGLDGRVEMEPAQVPGVSRVSAWAAAVLLGSLLGGVLGVWFMYWRTGRLDLLGSYVGLWMGAFLGTLAGAAMGMGRDEVRLLRIRRYQKRRLRELEVKAPQPMNEGALANQKLLTWTQVLAWCIVGYSLMVGLQLLFIVFSPLQKPVNWAEVFYGPAITLGSLAVLIGGAVGLVGFVERVSKNRRAMRRAVTRKESKDGS